MNDGWIKLHRKITEDELWRIKPFDKARALIDLFLLANHANGNKVIVGNKIVEIKPGQILTSEIKLSIRWGWSRQKVRDFLRILQQKGTIKTPNKTTKYTIITLVNWEFYQFGKQQIRQQKNNKKTSKKHQKDTFKNVKNVNNNKYISIYRDIFSHWNNQNIVKHKVLTENMKRAIKARLETFTPEEIKEAISNYAKIFHSPKYFLKYKFRLEDFLSRGAGSYMEKFLTSNDPFSSYLRDEERERKYKEETPAERRLRELREAQRKERGPPD